MRVRTNRSGLAHGLMLLALIALVATLVPAPPALADHCSGSGDIKDRGGDVVGECHGIVPGEPETYTMHELWDYYCDAAGPFQEGDEVGFYEVGPVEPDEIELFGLDPTGEYVWYDVICWHDGRGDIEIQIIVEVTPGVPPEVIRDIAAARLEPPPPAPETSPPLAAETFVQVPTWLWLDPAYWSPLEASETRGVVTVTVLATPTRATWAMGDGGETTCFGPGVAWTPGAAEDATDCAHTYEHSSYGEPDGRFDASVTVSWEFEWWINDAYQGVFGTVDLASGFGVAVAEIQAVETGG
ncbi:MAG: hypothetical protein P1T08_10940 [Acidimicrobiia bacterium]|nr:hypothetical protein [Acidimicrobiia bacterium]